MYKHVVLGGTFDHFHAGHRDLVSMAFDLGNRVTIGLTKASMNTSKRLASEILAYKIRKRSILEFAQKLGKEKDLTIRPITDLYGTTLQDQSLDAIVVTPHTTKGAEKINTERQKRGLSILEIETCQLRVDDSGRILSSTNIRQGLTNREGVSYLKYFTTDVHLSEETKSFIRRPFGRPLGARKIISQKSSKVVIGDIVTEYFVKHLLSFQTAYIDHRSKRQPYAFDIPNTYEVDTQKIQNPAGVITTETVEYLSSQALNHKNLIISVEGEEDLLTAACVLLLPFGTEVIFGYPFAPQSMRSIRINERIKEKFKEILFP